MEVLPLMDPEEVCEGVTSTGPRLELLQDMIEGPPKTMVKMTEKKKTHHRDTDSVDLVQTQKSYNSRRTQTQTNCNR